MPCFRTNAESTKESVAPESTRALTDERESEGTVSEMTN